MCCRYLLEESPELRPIIEEMNRSPLAGTVFPRGSLRASGEVRPSEAAPVVATDRAGRRAVFPMRWGFRLSHGDGSKFYMINARVETAASRPLFREAWQAHRCAVPASCYFEWEHPLTPEGRGKTGVKYCIRQDAPVTWLCGLYRMEEGVPCFTVLTREPGENIRFIHNRMPLILPEDAVPEWIRPETRPEDLLPLAQTELLFRPAG